MKKKLVKTVFFVVFALVTMACDSFWKIKDTSDIEFRIDTSVLQNSKSFQNGVRSIETDISKVTITLYDAIDNSEIEKKTEYFTDDTMIIIGFSELDIVGKNVYAKMLLESNGTIQSGTSDTKTMIIGANYLVISLDEIDDDDESVVVDTVKTPLIMVGPDYDSITGNKTVTIETETDNAHIFYTENGENPTKNSTLYTGEFFVTVKDEGVTVKAIAIKEGMHDSLIAEKTISKAGVVETPTIVYNSNPLSSGAEIDFSLGLSFTCETGGAIIEYKWDNEEYTTINEGENTGLIPNGTSSVTVKATKTGLENSAEATVSFTQEQVLQPQIVYNSNPLSSGAEIDFSLGLSFTCETGGAIIEYKWDNEEYTTINEGENTGLIPNGTSSVTVRATKTGLEDSTEATVSFTQEQVLQPQIVYNSNPLSSGAEIDFSLGLSFTCETGGAIIEYKWDNEEYTTINEGENTGLIPNGTTSVTVRATKTGLENSTEKAVSFTQEIPEFMKMVLIPGGTYDYQGTTSTTIDEFYLGATEVTQGQWEAVMVNVYGIGNDLWPNTNPSSTYGISDNHPAYFVSWENAIAFCNELSEIESLSPYYETDGTIIGGTGYRLPTEEEWEYAAGGGGSNRTTWSGTSTESKLIDYAWYTENAGGFTQIVGTAGNKDGSPQSGNFNDLGLFDMSGNVAEWCYDLFDSSNRALRGGNMYSSATNMEVVDRLSKDPATGGSTLGFRVARDGN